jgi:hypothetical protein
VAASNSLDAGRTDERGDAVECELEFDDAGHLGDDLPATTKAIDGVNDGDRRRAAALIEIDKVAGRAVDRWAAAY